MRIAMLACAWLEHPESAGVRNSGPPATTADRASRGLLLPVPPAAPLAHRGLAFAAAGGIWQACRHGARIDLREPVG
jgi:hypothetical protein